jgi:hypothetical protein
MLQKKPKLDRPPAPPLKLRREQLASDGAIAMADYLKARQATVDRMLELRAARLRQQFNKVSGSNSIKESSPMASNEPVGDNARGGAVRKRSQIKNPDSGQDRLDEAQ